MNTHRDVSRRGKDKSWMFGAAIVVIPVLLLGWWIWQSIWGFGGVYTHIRYIPTPENLIDDNATSAFDFDVGHTARRHYGVEMTQDELARFHQEALPRAGWTITTAAYVTLPRGDEHAYCLIARQRDQTAYISIRESAEPPIESGVMISLNTPVPSYCHFETMQ